MLADVIKDSGETRAIWAKRIGITAPYLSDLLNRKKIPSLELATRIERLTGGRVSASSWIDDVTDREDAA